MTEQPGAQRRKRIAVLTPRLFSFVRDVGALSGGVLSGDPVPHTSACYRIPINTFGCATKDHLALSFVCVPGAHTQRVN